MYKSLETNWIRKKSDKALPIPEVMYFPFSEADGCYYHPREKLEIYDIDGKSYSMKYGVIAVNPKNYKNIEETIAHEWRHHMQYFNGIDFGKLSYPLEIFNKLPYRKAIWEYFSESEIELDAIRFQYKYSTIFEVWESVLYKLIKDFRPRPIITYGK